MAGNAHRESLTKIPMSGNPSWPMPIQPAGGVWPELARVAAATLVTQNYRRENAAKEGGALVSTQRLLLLVCSGCRRPLWILTTRTYGVVHVHPVIRHPWSSFFIPHVQMPFSFFEVSFSFQ